jgi:hypothetical protein
MQTLRLQIPGRTWNGALGFDIAPVQGVDVKPSKRTFSTTLVVQVTIEKISSV